MRKTYNAFKKYFLLLQKINYRDSLSPNKPIGQIWWESKGLKWPREILSLIFIIFFYSILTLGIIYENSLESNQGYNLSLQIIGFFVLCVFSDSYLEKKNNKENIRSVLSLLPVSNTLIYLYLLCTNLLSYKLYCFAFYVLMLSCFNYSLGVNNAPVSTPIVLIFLVFINYILFTGAFNEIFQKNSKITHLRSLVIYIIGIPFAYAILFAKEYDYTVWNSINKIVMDNFHVLIVLLVLCCFFVYSTTIVYFFKRRLA
jgi:hypothetical protein